MEQLGALGGFCGEPTMKRGKKSRRERHREGERERERERGERKKGRKRRNRMVRKERQGFHPLVVRRRRLPFREPDA